MAPTTDWSRILPPRNTGVDAAKSPPCSEVRASCLGFDMANPVRWSKRVRLLPLIAHDYLGSLSLGTRLGRLHNRIACRSSKTDFGFLVT